MTNHLRYKEPPIINVKPISSLILNKDLYDIDKTYQRAPEIWTKEMEQYLIDSVLRGYSIPPIIIHKKGGKRFIVDGQQRWNAIMKFAGEYTGEDKRKELELGKKSKDIILVNEGKKKYKELNEYWRDRFNSYPLTLYLLEDYYDGEIRSTFLRLQESKPLTPGEKLNAYPGDIVLRMRELSQHEFLHKSIKMGLNRYRDYQMAAIFLFLEKEGIKSLSPKYIYDFFEKNPNLLKNSPKYQKIKVTLNYLRKTFKQKTPELRTQAWIVSIYLLTSHLIEEYAVTNKHNELKEFVINFYSQIEKAKEGSDPELLNYREVVSKGTNNEESIKLRYNILLKRYLSTYNPPRLDENRLFTEAQRIEIFRRDGGHCQICGENLEFGNENTHYHHKQMYSTGGPTVVDNGLLSCKKCHYLKLHGKKDRS